jgi:hypothetical protein
MEKGKENRILNAVAQTTKDTIMVGGEEYKLYPISLGKLDLIARHEKTIETLMKLVEDKSQDSSDADTKKKMEAAFDGAAELFHILTYPNDGKEVPDITPEEKKKLRWSLSTQNLFEIRLYLQTAHLPGDLLKNVSGLRGTEKAAGEISSA